LADAAALGAAAGLALVGAFAAGFAAVDGFAAAGVTAAEARARVTFGFGGWALPAGAGSSLEGRSVIGLAYRGWRWNASAAASFTAFARLS
jgi:hypothetical protein